MGVSAAVGTSVTQQHTRTRYTARCASYARVATRCAHRCCARARAVSRLPSRLNTSGSTMGGLGRSCRTQLEPHGLLHFPPQHTPF